MIICTGAPAEHYALSYLEGSLPEFEMERFEEHYFDCPVCLAHLQTLQAVAGALRSLPAAQLSLTRPIARVAWPPRVWVLAAAAALLVAGFVTLRIFVTGTPQPAVAHTAPARAPAQAPEPANPVSAQASQLADLALPAFIGARLRGESTDAHFEAGMKAYSGHNCNAASRPLSQVPETAGEWRAAQLYLGVCQMHLHNLPAASAALRKVADAGDSPQLEYALYYLAQASLLENDPVRAHRFLVHAVGLHGDLESRAHAQDRQVTSLIARNYQDKSQANRKK